MQGISLALFLCGTTLSVFAVELPEFLHVCKRNDPNMESCVAESVEALKPYLMKGVPEYHIPSLEPLLLKELVASQGTGIKITAKNVHAFGASNFHVKKLKFLFVVQRIYEITNKYIV